MRFFVAALTVTVCACATSHRRTLPDTAPCPPPVPTFDTSNLQERLATAQDRGLLWKLTKDGTTSYLYGTFHVGTPDNVLPGPKTMRALLSVPAIALEVDMVTRGQEAAQALTSRRVDVTLSSDERERVAFLAKRNCVDPARFDALPPTMQAMALTVVELQREGLFAAYGTDMILNGFAQGAKKQLLELESLATQVDALNGDAAEQKQMLLSMVEGMETEELQKFTRTLYQAWAASDLEGLTKLFRSAKKSMGPLSGGFDKRLFHDRNVSMAERIAKFHAQQPVFFAVGAGHMIGDDGLPALLTSAGFVVERLL